MASVDPPAQEPAAEAVTEAARDDVSVPPVDVDHADPVDRGFFDADFHLSDAAELEARDPKAALKRSQAMVVRRAHLAKYVTATMGVALALCVAALVKTAMTDNSSADKAARAESLPQGASTAPAQVDPTPTTTRAAFPPAAAAVPAPAESAVAQVAPSAPSAADTATPAQAAVVDSAGAPGTAVAPPAEPAAAVDPPKPSEPVAAAAPAEPPPQPPPTATPAPPQAQAAAAVIATTAPPATPTAVVPASAAGPSAPSAAAASTGASASREKEHARSALERSSLIESTGAGERSVALDPTDAEAWLILGAAYQARGDTKSASRCFKACTERSTHGPKGECAAMLH